MRVGLEGVERGGNGGLAGQYGAGGLGGSCAAAPAAARVRQCPTSPPPQPFLRPGPTHPPPQPFPTHPPTPFFGSYGLRHAASHARGDAASSTLCLGIGALSVARMAAAPPGLYPPWLILWAAASTLKNGAVLAAVGDPWAPRRLWLRYRDAIVGAVRVEDQVVALVGSSLVLGPMEAREEGREGGQGWGVGCTGGLAHRPSPPPAPPPAPPPDPQPAFADHLSPQTTPPRLSLQITPGSSHAKVFVLCVLCFGCQWPYLVLFALARPTRARVSVPLTFATLLALLLAEPLNYRGLSVGGVGIGENAYVRALAAGATALLRAAGVHTTISPPAAVLALWSFLLLAAFWIVLAAQRRAELTDRAAFAADLAAERAERARDSAASGVFGRAVGRLGPLPPPPPAIVVDTYPSCLWLFALCPLLLLPDVWAAAPSGGSGGR